MKHRTTTYKVRLHPDPAAVTKRATSIVEKLVNDRGYSHHDIARLCDTTVASLLTGGSPRLSKIQIKAMAKHFDVSILWLITGYGSEFVKT